MHPTLHHIALKVRNLERCEQFYTVVLGLRIMQRHREPDGSLRSVWFDLGGVILMVERCEGIT
ncbi:MAG: VOC family protein, partial [Desulfobulbaceae bacterium]